MVALRLAALWLGLIAQATVHEEVPRLGGEVISDALEVLDEPDDASYASGELKRGDRVTIAAEVRKEPGWLAIVPPTDSFHWVDASMIRVEADGRGVVNAERAPIRTGAAEAKMPGPPRPPLPRGTVVRLVDRPPLILGEGPKARTWRAIAPGNGEVRYVRAEGVRVDPVATVLMADDPKIQQTQVDRGGGGSGSASEAIRKFDEALQRSRRLDHDVAQVKRKLADARTYTERAYDAKGLLQASSRQVDGQKIHALIGPEGVPIAYLVIPPGIPANRMLSRKVGVRGEIHFNEALGTRLITVRDLDTLDKPR